MARKKRTKSTTKRTTRKKSESDAIPNGLDNENNEETVQAEAEPPEPPPEPQPPEASKTLTSNSTYKRFGKYRCLENKQNTSSDEEEDFEYNTNNLMAIDIHEMIVGGGVMSNVTIGDFTLPHAGVMGEVACDIVIENEMVENVVTYIDKSEEPLVTAPAIEEDGVLKVTRSEAVKCYSPKKFTSGESSVKPVISNIDDIISSNLNSPKESIKTELCVKSEIIDCFLEPSAPQIDIHMEITKPKLEIKLEECTTYEPEKAAVNSLEIESLVICEPEKLNVNKTLNKKIGSPLKKLTENKTPVPAIIPKKYSPSWKRNSQIKPSDVRKADAKKLEKKLPDAKKVQEKRADPRRLSKEFNNSKKINGDESFKTDSAPTADEEIKKLEVASVRRRSSRIRSNRWEDSPSLETVPPPPLLPPPPPPVIATPPPPSSLFFETDKPVKVKSRWRRTSELEMSTGLTSDSDQSVSAFSIKSPQNSPAYIELPKKLPLLTVHPEIEERLKSFEILTTNLFLIPRTRSKEAKRMVCDCTMTKDEMLKAEKGCGDDCLNRLLMIEW